MASRWNALLVLGLASALASIGCVSGVASRPLNYRMPPRDLVDASRGKPGVIVQTDRPARVYRGPLPRRRWPGRRELGDRYRPAEDSLDYDFQLPMVCDTTPCRVPLPPGRHELVFVAHADRSRRSVGYVHASSARVFMEHSVGYRDRDLSRVGMVVVGVGAAVLFATAVYGISELHRDPATGRESLDPGATAPVVAGGAASGGLVVAGFVLMGIGSARNRSGVTKHWCGGATRSRGRY